MTIYKLRNHETNEEFLEFSDEIVFQTPCIACTNIKGCLNLGHHLVDWRPILPEETAGVPSPGSAASSSSVGGGGRGRVSTGGMDEDALGDAAADVDERGLEVAGGSPPRGGASSRGVGGRVSQTGTARKHKRSDKTADGAGGKATGGTGAGTGTGAKGKPAGKVGRPGPGRPPGSGKGKMSGAALRAAAADAAAAEQRFEDASQPVRKRNRRGIFRR